MKTMHAGVGSVIHALNALALNGFADTEAS